LKLRVQLSQMPQVAAQWWRAPSPPSLILHNRTTLTANDLNYKKYANNKVICSVIKLLASISKCSYIYWGCLKVNTIYRKMNWITIYKANT
jgi:hypothetical protein